MITPAVLKAPFQVNTTGTGTQAYGQVAPAPDGTYFSVWVDYSSSTGKLVGRKLDAGGTPLSGEMGLESTGGDIFPSVAVTSDGKPHIAFTFNTDTYLGSRNADLSANGSFMPIETGGLTSTHPAITAFSDGSLFVSYTVQNSATDWDILGRPVSASGTVGSTVTLFDDTDQSDNSRLATLDNGNFVITYESQFLGSTTDHDIFFQIRSKTGGSILGSTNVQGAGSGNLDTNADVTALHSGGFVVVWTTGASTDHDIHGTVYDRDGNVVRAPFTVNTTTTGHQDEAHVTSMDDGGFLVTWEDYNANDQKAQRFDAVGNKLGPEIETHTGPVLLTSTETLADGRTVLSFDDLSNGDYNVFNEILDTRTNVTGHATGHDLFGDGTGDALILSTSTANNTPGGLLTMFDLSATGALTQIGQVGTDWTVAGSGDFNKDGHADLLMQHDSGAARDIYSFTMGTTAVTGITKLGTVGQEWQIDGTGDFNGDGFKDILMERLVGGTKQFETFGVQNNAITSFTNSGNVPAADQVDGIGDFNHDGIDDILIHYDAGGAHNFLILTQNNYATSAITAIGSVGLEWNISGVGDFNHDGYADLLGYYDTATQRILVELVNPGASGGGFSLKTIGPVGKNIQIDGIGDMNGDGTADISAHYDPSGTGRTDLYLEMHNSAVTNIVTTGAVGHEWIVS